MNGRLPRRILPQSGLQNFAQNDFVNPDSSADTLENSLDVHGSEFHGGDGGQRPVETADSGASRTDDDNFVHNLISPLECFLCNKGNRLSGVLMRIPPLT